MVITLLSIHLIFIMAPSAVETTDFPVISSKQDHREPLKSSGSLDKFESIDITPVIGTEYPTANLVEWINSPNADELIRDLAIKSKKLNRISLVTSLTFKQFPNVALYSSEPKIT